MEESYRAYGEYLLCVLLIFRVLTASVTPDGVQMGGVIGVVAPLLLGLWEAIRDEFNGRVSSGDYCRCQCAI